MVEMVNLRDAVPIWKTCNFFVVLCSVLCTARFEKAFPQLKLYHMLRHPRCGRIFPMADIISSIDIILTSWILSVFPCPSKTPIWWILNYQHSSGSVIKHEHHIFHEHVTGDPAQEFWRNPPRKADGIEGLERGQSKGLLVRGGAKKARG